MNTYEEIVHPPAEVEEAERTVAEGCRAVTAHLDAHGCGEGIPAGTLLENVPCEELQRVYEPAREASLFISQTFFRPPRMYCGSHGFTHVQLCGVDLQSLVYEPYYPAPVREAAVALLEALKGSDTPLPQCRLRHV